MHHVPRGIVAGPQDLRERQQPLQPQQVEPPLLSVHRGHLGGLPAHVPLGGARLARGSPVVPGQAEELGAPPRTSNGHLQVGLRGRRVVPGSHQRRHALHLVQEKLLEPGELVGLLVGLVRLLALPAIDPLPAVLILAVWALPILALRQHLRLRRHAVELLPAEAGVHPLQQLQQRLEGDLRLVDVAGTAEERGRQELWISRRQPRPPLLQ
mmetsp:Transcript_50471/g.156152  ORF Transcript_50471/g.156152 Transcript_50471/m.156152 type:complete len:211 (-) Transcript_50471:551-1183(-)